MSTLLTVLLSLVGGAIFAWLLLVLLTYFEEQADRVYDVFAGSAERVARRLRRARADA